MNAVAPALDASPARPRLAVRVPWPALLGPLPNDDAQALDALATLRSVPEGEAVVQRGSAARHLVALLEGQAACGWSQPERGLSAERVLHGPAWLVLAGPLGDGSQDCDVVAQTRLQVAELAAEPLRALIARRPMLSLRFIDTLAREVGRLDGRLHALMHKDAGARLAAWLCEQSQGRTQAVLRLAERKRDIASQLGMTPETLSRMMRSLSERGLIAVSGYTVRVLDAEALQGLAGA
jgi:CRP-like cAMP-binding protein